MVYSKCIPDILAVCQADCFHRLLFRRHGVLWLRSQPHNQGLAHRGVRVRLSDKAYQLIRHKIITLELSPLSAIDEQALMEDLQLGRTPIREALQRLAAEDLVLLAPRRGMFVSDISITDLQKVFELRLMLESFCARLAAKWWRAKFVRMFPIWPR